MNGTALVVREPGEAYFQQFAIPLPRQAKGGEPENHTFAFLDANQAIKASFVALKPTIYRLKISLSDLNRNYYDTLNLTVARHPSETIERMMARVLAFCINAQEHLAFTKGIGSAEEPDIWARMLDDTISLWIDVGEPSIERLKKAKSVASAVRVYSFNSKSTVWWNQGRAGFNELRVSVFRFRWENIQRLADLVQRTMDLSVTITGDSAYIAAELGECEIGWVPLQVT